MADVSFKKAILILDKLLEGKTRKEIIYELDCDKDAVTIVRNKFPLFLGLPRRYNKDE